MIYISNYYLYSMKNLLDGLLKAFVGESQARNRYTFFSSIAKDEGYEQVADIFSITADNEKEHANWFYKMIKEVAEKQGANVKNLKTETGVPFTFGKTPENIQSAIEGETYEYKTMYPEIAELAKKEGFIQISARIRAIVEAEKHHADRYSKLISNFENGNIFVKDEPVWWMCRECGFIHFGKKAPLACPSCSHPRAFYQVLSENY